MSPSSMMRPSLLAIVRARTSPVLLTTASSRLLAVFAVSTTWPPSARMAPPLSTKAFSAPSSMATPTSESPPKFSVTLLPAAAATVPSVALTVPSLRTALPISAM